MKLLLDTHIILWMFGDPAALSVRSRGLLEDIRNDLFFSPISLFEIAVKSTKKRSDFAAEATDVHRELILRDIVELPLQSEQVMRVTSLPPIHKDPFDRLLLAQALSEDLMLLTMDDTLLRYPYNVLDAR